MKYIWPILLFVWSFAAAMAQSNAPVGPTSGSGGGGNAALIPNYTANGGLPNWQHCRAQVKTGTGTGCIILAMGASQSTGHGSFFNVTASDAHSGSWVHQLGLNLVNAGIAAESNTVSGNNAIAPTSTYDTRITQGTWAPVAGVFIIGSQLWANGDATSSFTFNSSDTATYSNVTPIQTNRVDVYWIGTSAPTANLTLDVGGSVFCTINVNTPSSTYNKTTCSAASLAANTYNLKCSSATAIECTWGIIDAYNNAAPQVHLINGAADGTTIEQFVTNTGEPWDPLASLSVIKPILCTYDQLANDAGAQTALATYTANLTALVNACKAQDADVLLLTGLPLGTDTSPITIEQYQAAMISVAAATGVPVWDSMAAYGGLAGWAKYIPFGWNAAEGGELTHWSVASNVYEASIIMQILQQ